MYSQLDFEYSVTKDDNGNTIFKIEDYNDNTASLIQVGMPIEDNLTHPKNKLNINNVHFISNIGYIEFITAGSSVTEGNLYTYGALGKQAWDVENPDNKIYNTKYTKYPEAEVNVNNSLFVYSRDYDNMAYDERQRINRAITVTNGAKLNLTGNTTISRSNAATGGAIYCDGDMTINGTKESPILFIGNWAKAHGGGAIFIYGTNKDAENNINKNINISYANFISNRAATCFYNSSELRGGAIAIGNGKVNIDNCLFEDNSAHFGGAIALEPIVTSKTNTTISNSIIRNNISRVDGGGIYWGISASDDSTNRMSSNNMNLTLKHTQIYDNITSNSAYLDSSKSYFLLYNYLNNYLNEDEDENKEFLNDGLYSKFELYGASDLFLDGPATVDDYTSKPYKWNVTLSSGEKANGWFKDYSILNYDEEASSTATPILMYGVNYKIFKYTIGDNYRYKENSEENILYKASSKNFLNNPVHSKSDASEKVYSLALKVGHSDKVVEEEEIQLINPLTGNINYSFVIFILGFISFVTFCLLNIKKRIIKNI